MGSQQSPLDHTPLARGGGPGLPAPPARDTRLRCQVAVAPVAVSDGMYVIVPGQEHGLEIVAGNWEPRRDVELPAVGNTCVVVFDSDGDAWVPIWSPY